MISDEDLTLLSAYQDGELEGETLSHLRERLLQEPELRRELDSIQEADELLTGFAAGIDEVAVPANISALVRPGTARSAVSLFAVAATVFAVTIGTFLVTPDESIDYALLDRLGSGQREAMGEDHLEVIATFRQLDGRYCREFMTNRTHQIACRTGTAWRTMIEVSRHEIPADAYQPAGVELGEIDHYVREHISGTTLEAGAERILIDNNWR